MNTLIRITEAEKKNYQLLRYYIYKFGFIFSLQPATSNRISTGVAEKQAKLARLLLEKLLKADQC